MTNDTSTLYGSLLEMKDQLIYELGEKGVTASYDSSTGLLGLIGKISEIEQGGGSCYHIEFSEDSYTAVGGSATLEISLQENYAPKSGATISVSGSDSSLYTGLTNNDGVAQVTVNNVSGTVTFTGSYSNVSAQCTVTGQTYLFYDDCTSDRSNEYSNQSIQASSKTNYLPLTYNSAGYYTIQATRNEGAHYVKWIDDVTGEDNLKFTCEVSTNTLSGTNRFGIVVGDGNYKSERWQFSNNVLECQTMSNGSESMQRSSTLSLSTDTWYRMEWVISGTSYTFTVKNMSDTVLYTYTGTFNSSVITSSTTKRYGLYYLNYSSTAIKKYRNIKVESL